MAKSHTIRILNKSKQSIPLQVRPEGGDFFLHEQQVWVGAGKNVSLPKSHVMMDQIRNLQARGMLRIISDSEALEDSRLA